MNTDRVMVLNLLRRTDRRERMRERLSQAHLTPDWRLGVEATSADLPPGWTATPGAWGCSLGWQDVFRDALTADLDRIVCFEDDATWGPDFMQWWGEAEAELPADYQIFYLGCNNIEPPVAVTDRIARVRQAYCTHAFVIRQDAMLELLRHPRLNLDAIDHVLLDIQRTLSCYCVTPSIATQETDFSDVQQCDVDYTDVIR